MKKINLLFPLLFVIALAGSAFTRQSLQKKKAFGVNAFYQDQSNFCDQIWVDDPNCSPDLLGPVCEEFILDNQGWTVMYEFGTSVVCWQPLYSLYPNNP